VPSSTSEKANKGEGRAETRDFVLERSEGNWDLLVMGKTKGRKKVSVY